MQETGIQLELGRSMEEREGVEWEGMVEEEQVNNISIFFFKSSFFNGVNFITLLIY